MKYNHQERVAMVDRKKSGMGLNLKQQCMLLSVGRSSLYYKPISESEENLRMMRKMDEIHLRLPFYGSRRITNELRDEGFNISRKKVCRLMKLMDFRTIYPHASTSVPCPQDRRFPYLLHGLEIDHCNQVWEMDITYIPMKKGFMYLAAIIDVFSRYIVGWGISNTMDTEWCMEIVQEAFRKHGHPEIFNTDQGSQFTSKDFTDMLIGKDVSNPLVRISRDGRGRATDDIYIERFWRSIKQENIYLNAYETGTELWKGVSEYMLFYNTLRPHSSLDYKQPSKIYFKNAA